MVEGPCLALFAERLRARVRRGQAVRGARGGAAPAGAGSATATSEERTSVHNFLTGHVYRGVETLGKELFMYFDQKALRIHFGINGSMRINPDGSKDRNGALPVLEIQLTEDTICFFGVTTEYRSAAESEQKVRMMESLDVCSPKFSFLRAESEIKQQKTRMLCDVLLDQTVLPGVGNIIKNEALFDSGLHPAVKLYDDMHGYDDCPFEVSGYSSRSEDAQVCQLTDEQIHHLVKMTRDFTLLFYKCRKTGSPLYKHYKVYRCRSCGQCNGKITVCRLGENDRMTYFCSQCQKADPQLVNVSKLPARNSLIGWAYGRGSCSNEHIAQKCEEEWTCMCCTLINKPSAEVCDACLTSRPEGFCFNEETYCSGQEINAKYMSELLASEASYNEGSRRNGSTLCLERIETLKAAESQANSFYVNVPKTQNAGDSAAFNTKLMKYPCNEFGKPSTEIKINRRAAFGTTTLVLTDLGNKVVLKNDNQISDGCSEYAAPESNCDQTHNNVYHSGRNMDKHSSTNVTAVASPSYQEPFSLKPIKKKQKTHHVPSVHQYNVTSGKPQVNITDDNRIKMGHPRCSKHSCLCSLRVVRKDGENKGRQFYTCPLPMETRCDYFQWADLHFPFCNHGKRCVMKTVLKIGPNNGKNFFVCPFGKEKQCSFFQWAENESAMQVIP